MSALGKEIAEAVIEAWFGERSDASGKEIAAVDAAIAPLVEAARLAEDIIDDLVGHLTPHEQANDPDVGECLSKLRAILAHAGGAA